MIGTKAQRANGTITPIKIIVEISCIVLLRKNAAKSAKFLSTSEVSFVSLLIILPIGVVWKNDIGALHKTSLVMLESPFKISKILQVVFYFSDSLWEVIRLS